MISALLVGVARASRNWKMILLLLVTSIIVATPAAVPIFLVIVQTSRKTLAAPALLADKLDAVWLIDLVNEQFAGTSFVSVALQVAVLLLVVAVVYLLVNVLFAGGIIEVFAAEDSRFSIRRFFSGVGAHFWRFVRLWLVSLIAYGIAFAAYAIALLRIDAADKLATTEAPGAIRKWVATIVLLLLLAIINMTFDYARIGAVLNERRKMFRETFRAARFAFRHFARAFGLYLIIAMIGMVVFWLVARLRNLVPQTSLFAVMVAFILGQLAIASRMWTRLAFYAGEVDLYQRLVPPVAPVPPPSQPVPEFAAAIEVPPVVPET